VAIWYLFGSIGADGGNAAVTSPESAAFVAVALATVKKFSDTPDSVYPDFGVIVIVAVYTVADANVE
jgi:hypothetical protein